MQALAYINILMSCEELRISSSSYMLQMTARPRTNRTGSDVASQQLKDLWQWLMRKSMVRKCYEALKGVTVDTQTRRAHIIIATARQRVRCCVARSELLAKKK